MNEIFYKVVTTNEPTEGGEKPSFWGKLWGTVKRNAGKIAGALIGGPVGVILGTLLDELLKDGKVSFGLNAVDTSEFYDPNLTTLNQLEWHLLNDFLNEQIPSTIVNLSNDIDGLLQDVRLSKEDKLNSLNKLLEKIGGVKAYRSYLLSKGEFAFGEKTSADLGEEYILKKAEAINTFLGTLEKAINILVEKEFPEYVPVQQSKNITTDAVEGIAISFNNDKVVAKVQQYVTLQEAQSPANTVITVDTDINKGPVPVGTVTDEISVEETTTNKGSTTKKVVVGLALFTTIAVIAAKSNNKSKNKKDV